MRQIEKPLLVSLFVIGVFASVAAYVSSNVKKASAAINDCLSPEGTWVWTTLPSGVQGLKMGPQKVAQKFFVNNTLKYVDWSLHGVAGKRAYPGATVVATEAYATCSFGAPNITPAPTKSITPKPTTKVVPTIKPLSK